MQTQTINPSTPSQRQLIHRLCNYDAELKQDLVSQYSQGRTTTSMELTEQEANHIIYSLQHWARFDSGNSQHRYILSLCIQNGWSRTHWKFGQVADIDRLSNFLKSNRSPVRKPLQQMTKAECSKIISCLESMITKHNGRR